MAINLPTLSLSLSLSAKLILLFHCYFFSFKEVRHARLLVDMANRRRTLRSLFNLLGHLFVVREDMKVKFCLWGNTGQVLFVRTLRSSFVCEDTEVKFCLWGYGGHILFLRIWRSSLFVKIWRSSFVSLYSQQQCIHNQPILKYPFIHKERRFSFLHPQLLVFVTLFTFSYFVIKRSRKGKF